MKKTEHTAQLLLKQSSAVQLGFLGSRVRRGTALEQRSLIFDLLLEYRHVFLQCLLRRICPAGLAFETGDSTLHLLPFNLPRVPVTFMSVPFGLEKAHNTCVGPSKKLAISALLLHLGKSTSRKLTLQRVLGCRRVIESIAHGTHIVTGTGAQVPSICAHDGRRETCRHGSDSESLAAAQSGHVHVDDSTAISGVCLETRGALVT